LALGKGRLLAAFEAGSRRDSASTSSRVAPGSSSASNSSCKSWRHSVKRRLTLDKNRVAVAVFQLKWQSRVEPRRRDSGNSGKFVENSSLRLGHALSLG